MRNRTVYTILVIAGLLVGFIFLFERGSMTTSEKMARKGRVFTEFKEDAVTGLEIVRKGKGKVVIERDMLKQKMDEEQWNITSPQALRADAAAVRQILSALDFLLVDRAVQGEKSAEFGLTDPRITASFTLNGKATTFRVGAEAKGEKVYLATDSAPGMVYVVSPDIVEALDKGVNDLRDRKMVAATLDGVSRIVLKRPQGKVELEQQEERWRVKSADTWVLAAEDQARDLVNAVRDLEADEFIADGVKDAGLGKYGLDKPAVSIALTPKEGEPVTVALGKACPGEEKRWYARVAGTGTVACVLEDIATVTERPLLRFQETRPAVFDVDDVEKVTLSSGGRSLSLEKEEEKWTLASGDVALDSDAVDKMLRSLTETRATAVSVGDEAVSTLGAAAGGATFTLADDLGEVALEWFGGEDDETARMRRKDEPAVLTVPAVLTRGLTPEVLAFRSRTLENGDENDAARIVIKGPAAQTLERKEGIWTLVKPFEVAADAAAARTLAGLVATVKADAFVAPKAAPEHGLSAPWAEVTVTFETLDDEAEGDAKPKQKAVTLQLGAESEIGKRFARLKGADPVVFTVGDDYENALSSPLIARDLLEIDDVNATTLSLATPEKTLKLVKTGDAWKAEDDTPVDTEALGRIVADLGGIKTVSTAAFGKEDVSFGETALTLSVTTTAEDAAAVKTITVGARSPNPTEDGYLARLEGVDATFVLPARIIDDILKFLGSGK